MLIQDDASDTRSRKVVAASVEPATLPHPDPLPLGEGEFRRRTSSQRRHLPESLGEAEEGQWLFPLPAGESQGEGERAECRGTAVTELEPLQTKSSRLHSRHFEPRS